MLDSISNTAASTQSQKQDSQADKARSQLSGDFESFMLLLTTQLKNQDPVEPLDTHEFTAQLVQFASVEQAIATNENLEEMIAADKGTEVANAASYIGKFVEAKGNEGRLKDGVATFSYNLPERAQTAEIIIRNENDSIVFKGEAPVNAGKNDVIWDGSTNTNSSGDIMEDGIYKFSIIAKDRQGESIEAETRTTGFISAVNLEDGKASYQIGNIGLSLSDIIAVRNPSEFATEN